MAELDRDASGAKSASWRRPDAFIQALIQGREATVPPSNNPTQSRNLIGSPPLVRFYPTSPRRRSPPERGIIPPTRGMMNFPRELVEAVRKNQVVPFVGAGVSMGVKRGAFPSWIQLL